MNFEHFIFNNKPQKRSLSSIGCYQKILIVLIVVFEFKKLRNSTSNVTIEIFSFYWIPYRRLIHTMDQAVYEPGCLCTRLSIVQASYGPGRNPISCSRHIYHTTHHIQLARPRLSWIGLVSLSATELSNLLVPWIENFWSSFQILPLYC